MNELPPNFLTGYCEHCDHWTKYDTKDPSIIMNGTGCEKCGGKFSTRVGYQITTQRTFNPTLTRKKIKR